MTTIPISRAHSRRSEAGRRRAPYVPPSSGGVSAGLRGGLLTIGLLCARSWLAAEGPWLPMKAMAAVWLGPAALLGGWETAALGAATHLAGAALGGGLFAVVLGRRARAPAALALGLALGGALYVIARFAVLPTVDRTLWIRVQLMPVWWLLVYLAYGACLGLVPSLRRRSAREVLERRAPRPSATFF